jgi:hypothetical protein
MVATLALEDCLRAMHQCCLQALTELAMTVKQVDSLHLWHPSQGAPSHIARLTSPHSSSASSL